MKHPIRKKIKLTIYKFLYHAGLSKAVSNIIYKKVFGRSINWKHPNTLNEKLMVLKHGVFFQNPLISQCADKVRMRDYVREKGCEEVLTELLEKGIYEYPEQIDWEALPKRFALKCNHGCKMNIIVPDKALADKDLIYKQLRMWQQKVFGYTSGEWQYLSIKPLIICEHYYGYVDGRFPIDYKFFCLNGDVACIEVCSGREKGHAQYLFMDRNWNRLYIDSGNYGDDCISEQPKHLNQMIHYAEVLSADFPFVRVDFYECEGKVILSELTFTPSFNCIRSMTEEGQIMLGNRLRIE